MFVGRIEVVADCSTPEKRILKERGVDGEKISGSSLVAIAIENTHLRHNTELGPKHIQSNRLEVVAIDGNGSS